MSKNLKEICVKCRFFRHIRHFAQKRRGFYCITALLIAIFYIARA